MVFSIPSYLGLGDRPKRVTDERSRGVNIVVAFPKTGKGNDAYLDGGEISNRYIWNGDRTVALETMHQRELAGSAKRFLTPNGFVAAGPSKKGEGLGSYFGCFQKTPYPHVPNHPLKQSERVAGIKARKAERESSSSDAARGIYTSPAQKGTGYGYPGLALSDVGCDYVASYYDAPQRAAREHREEWAKKMPAEPFKPGGRRGFTFDESLSTGVSRCYIMTAPFKEKKPEPVLAHLTISAPWRPAGYVDDSPATMEYWEDPYRGYDPRLEPKDYVKKPSDEVFRPSSCSDTFWYTQSIVFKRL